MAGNAVSTIYFPFRDCWWKRVPDSNLVDLFSNNENQRMRPSSFERVFASWIYFLLGVTTAHIFWVGLANGIASGYHYSIEQKLLTGGVVTGTATLLCSAVFVYFRPAKAYVMAMVALSLLLLAFWPLLNIVIHQGCQFCTYSDLFAAVLLPVVAVFTPLRLLKLRRERR